MEKKFTRAQAEEKLNKILKNLDGYNIYIHHIWGLHDPIESIKNYIFLGGLDVKYDRGMFSTVALLNNANADTILDYFFANNLEDRINVVMAIPKELEINGINVPFSENLLEYKPQSTLYSNEAYINMFDVLRKNGGSIPREFVVGAVQVGKDMFGIEINENFNPHKVLTDYQWKAISTLNIGENDTKESIVEKTLSYMDHRNADIGNRMVIEDFDID